MISAWQDRLPAYSLYAAVLSAAGLPIYIFAPKFYADSYGVSLTALAAVLFGLRLFDVIQDPVLGWVSERLRATRSWWLACGSFVLAASMLGLFAVVPPIAPIWWFALTVTGLFTAFSFLTINFYAQGVQKAGATGQIRLAAWRETGALLGVCIAAIAPTVLAVRMHSPYTGFAVGFSVITLLAAAWMHKEWKAPPSIEPSPINAILADPIAKRLLLLALVNATPLAVSSTLFLFFVESRLAAPGWEGGLLVLFFLSAAIAAPFWSLLAEKHGAKRVLLGAMIVSIIAFAYALSLSQGDVIQFAVICVITGVTIGADLTLLPAMFAKRLAQISPNGGQGFGLWSLVNKFTLAIAAVVLLPLLERSGFAVGQTIQPERALTTLTVLYAAVPCVLKIIAVALLSATNLKDPR